MVNEGEVTGSLFPKGLRDPAEGHIANDLSLSRQSTLSNGFVFSATLLIHGQIQWKY